MSPITDQERARAEQEQIVDVVLCLRGERRAVGCFIREGICEVELAGFEITFAYPKDADMRESETSQHAYAEWAGLEPGEEAE